MSDTEADRVSVITAAADERAAATTRIADRRKRFLPSIQWEFRRFGSMKMLRRHPVRSTSLATPEDTSKTRVTITVDVPDGGPITVPGEVTISRRANPRASDRRRDR